MDWYNGFSPAERNANGRALNKAIRPGRFHRRVVSALVRR